MADDQVPPVVAVVVTFDPGPWLEQCLAALRGQDYGALSTLVVDAASTRPLAERVAGAAPEVYLHRLDRNDGFGPSANAGAALVEGAAFYLFCHDDVVPDQDAVRRLVEEAYRSNASVVGPKLVDLTHPDRLLAVGLGVDRFGAPIRRVQPGELDQSQHDEARDVFAVPGALTLVRADLFDAIGGFDPAISMLGEDVDLCWRARIAGARVVVAPLARVRHVEATASRQRLLPEARALQWRHELRAVLKNYGRLRRAAVVAQLLVLSALETAYFALAGKRWRARLVLHAWRWNLSRRAELRAVRAVVAASRRLSDREVRAAMEGGGSRLERSARRLAEGSATGRGPEAALVRERYLRRLPGGAGPPGLDALSRLRTSRGAALALLVVAAVLVVGARSLFVGHLPLVGQLVPFPGPPRLLGDYFGGWNAAGLQGTGPASPALGVIGLAGLLIGGGTSLVWKVVVLGCIPLGALGAWRLVGRFGASTPARLSAAVAYLFLPLAWDDLARGQAVALVAFACAPFVLARLLHASVPPAALGDVPAQPAQPATAPPAARARGRGPAVASSGVAEQACGLGILLALGAAFAPVLLPMTLEIALAVLLGVLAAGGRARLRDGVRACAVAGGAVLLALVLLLPWSVTFFQSVRAWSVLTGALREASGAPTLAQVVRFDVGPLGHGLLGYAFLVAALGGLVLGRAQRLEAATRLAVVSVVAFAVAWSAGRGWLGPGGGDTRALLAPAAAAVAACVGLSVASLQADLAERRLGWRHAAAALCSLAALAGLLPVLGASGSGRFGVPTTGYDTVLSYLGPGSGVQSGVATGGAAAAATGSGTGAPSEGSVLWLGDPDALPLVGWQVQPGLAAGVSAALPDGTAVFPSPSAGLAGALGDDVVRAASGLSVTLGSLLATGGVRYLVVTTATAPALSGLQNAVSLPPPPRLVAALAAQQDLRRLPSEGGAVVFANTAWRPGPPASALSGGTPAALRSLAIAGSLLALAASALWMRKRRRAARRTRRPAHLAAGHHRADAERPLLAEEQRELVLSVRRR